MPENEKAETKKRSKKPGTKKDETRKTKSQRPRPDISPKPNQKPYSKQKISQAEERKTSLKNIPSKRKQQPTRQTTNPP
jgi:hypothetical protein